MPPVEPAIPQRPSAPKPPVTKAATKTSLSFNVVKDELADNQPLPDQHELLDASTGPSDTNGEQAVTEGTGESNGTGSAVEGQTQAAEPTIFDENVVDEAASFPGGLSALSRYLQRNLRDPRTEEDSVGSVRVRVRFIVEAAGSLTGLEVIGSGGKKFDREVLRVIEKMPRWKPALKNGKPVAMFFVQPVMFMTPEE